jgi:hypothetical protein
VLGHRLVLGEGDEDGQVVALVDAQKDAGKAHFPFSILRVEISAEGIHAG